MNCKPGDLAIVVLGGSGLHTPGIDGRIVEIVRVAVSGEIFRSLSGDQMRRSDDAPAWVVHSSRPLPWLSSNGPNAGKILLFAERPIRDCNLRPISGVPLDDEVTEDLKEPA